MPTRPGRHFLQIPGPTNVPDRILRAISYPTMDHRSPEAGLLGLECLEGMKTIFQTKTHVAIYPGSGTGAWEAALANTLDPGDTVVAFDNGQFGALWMRAARNFGLIVDVIPGDWRKSADLVALAARLDDDKQHRIKAILAVHNETATGVTTNIKTVRDVIDAARHPALLMVDTVSSLGSIEYRHDEWQVDVAIAGSQKGMMLPPGLAFQAMSEKAVAASKRAKLPCSYWRWDAALEFGSKGYFPYTPATNLLYGLREAIAMMHEEGLVNVYRRHQRHGEATRRAVRGWGLEVFALNPAEQSHSATAVLMPEGHSETELRAVILRELDMSLGAGLGKLAGKVFRIGHLGSLNDLMLSGALCGVEMGLELAGVPHKKGGVQEALAYLAANR